MKEADSGPNLLARVPRRNLTGAEALGGVIGKKVLDFWTWAHSDILENVQRGIFAEYLVATALGIEFLPREGWANFDLLYGTYKIEVKSSAYLQSWAQPVLSKISFGIGAKIGFYPEGSPERDARYAADCFVFCVFTDVEPLEADVLNADRWRFYVVPTSDLIRACGAQKTVVQSRIAGIADSVTYPELKAAIDASRTGHPILKTAPHNFPVKSRRSSKRKIYVVWERGTHVHPVLVNAGSAEEARLLARADSWLVRSGVVTAAQEISASKALELSNAGAIDLRNPQG